MYKVVILGLLLVGAVGCGNHDGISDTERIAELRNKREEYDRSWAETQRRVDMKVEIERMKNR